MNNEYSIIENTTLKARIEALPDDSVLFRSDFPEYHSEFVGSTLSGLTGSGVLSKIAQGIYVKPRKSRFGLVLPSVEKVVQAIATRDNAEVLPSGMTALNALGLSTQVPMNYTYLTTGSERTITLTNRQVVLKRGVPKNFCYETRLIALLVQALRTLKQENVGNEELQIIRELLSKESDKENLTKDIDMMPGWMKRIVKPMLNIYAFRGSDSKYMESLMHEKESVQYELIENYRSKHNLVQFSNTFVPQSYATRNRCGCFVAPMGGS